MKNKENKRRKNQKSRREFNALKKELLRKELKKATPDPELINLLLDGDKYLNPFSKRLN